MSAIEDLYPDGDLSPEISRSIRPAFAAISARRRNGSHHSDERVADAADEAELDDIYETERRLLYVACTRAREHLLLTGVTPVSEYLSDLQTIAR